jgi:hypothetical protein
LGASKIIGAVIIFLILVGATLCFVVAFRNKSRKERLLKIWGTWLACSLIGFLAVYIDYRLRKDYEVFFGGMLISEVILVSAIFASLATALKPPFWKRKITK